MPLFNDVCAAIVYAGYKKLIAQGGEGDVEPYDIYSRQIVPFSNDYLWRAFDHLVKRELIFLHPESSKIFVLTPLGINSVEEGEQGYSEAYGRICGDDKEDERGLEWRNPDSFGNLREVDLEEVRKILVECRTLIERQSLSQQDRSQAEQHIKAAQEITEAPTPRLKTVWEIMKPFSNSFLAEAAKRILQLLLPGS